MFPPSIFVRPESLGTFFNFPGIGVERHTPRLQRGVEGAIPSCPFPRSRPSGQPRIISEAGMERYHRLRPLRGACGRCPASPHRPGRGGSSPPARRVHSRVASIAAMQRSLKPQSTGQHRGDPPIQVRNGECGKRNAESAGARRLHSALRIPSSAFESIRGETIIILRFGRRVRRWESCRMHQFTPR